MLWMPALSALIRIVPEPLAIRSISKLSDGMVMPCAIMIIGTRRTMPSRSGLMVNRPRPAAASSSTGTLRSSPGNWNMKGCGSSPSIASPVTGRFSSRSRANVRAARFSQHHARIADGIGKNPVIARQRPQSRAHLFVEIAEGVSEELGIEPVGLGEHGVERDHHGAEPGQVGNDVGDARPRPRPLTESRIGQAPFVDVDDRDRPHRLLAWFQHLEDIEGSDPHLGDRSRIPNPQRGKADQERKADQPRIAEAPLEPPPYDPQPFHAVWISRLGGLSRRKPLLPAILQPVRRPEPRSARPSGMDDEVGGEDAVKADVLQEDGVSRIDRDQGVRRVRR